MAYRVISMVFFLTATLFASPTRAQGNAALLEEKLKTSVNRMVQKVRISESPDTKRQILADYLFKMENGLKEIKTKHSLSAKDKQSVAALEGEFQGYLSILEGSDGADAVADGDLDAFAGSIQQGMEQAGFSTGGFYISTGALIIIF